MAQDRGDADRRAVADIVGEPEVDCAVDAVGFEASAQPGEEASAVVLN